MAGVGIVDCRHCYRSPRYNAWWLHAYNMACVIFWVDPYHNLYGGIDDTSLLGEQKAEMELRDTIRKAWQDFFIRDENKGYSCFYYGVKEMICKRQHKVK